MEIKLYATTKSNLHAWINKGIWINCDDKAIKCIYTEAKIFLWVEEDWEIVFTDSSGVPSSLFQENGISRKLAEYFVLDDKKKAAYFIVNKKEHYDAVADWQYDEITDWDSYWMEWFIRHSGYGEIDLLDFITINKAKFKKYLIENESFFEVKNQIWVGGERIHWKWIKVYW